MVDKMRSGDEKVVAREVVRGCGMVMKSAGVGGEVSF